MGLCEEWKAAHMRHRIKKTRPTMEDSQIPLYYFWRDVTTSDLPQLCFSWGSYRTWLAHLLLIPQPHSAFSQELLQSLTLLASGRWLSFYRENLDISVICVRLETLFLASPFTVLMETLLLWTSVEAKEMGEPRKVDPFPIRMETIERSGLSFFSSFLMTVRAGWLLSQPGQQWSRTEGNDFPWLLT